MSTLRVWRSTMLGLITTWLAACASSGVEAPRGPADTAAAGSATALPNVSAPVPAPPPATGHDVPDGVGETWHIHFRQGDELGAAETARLSACADRLRSDATLRLRLSGYIPSRGSRSYEMAMAERRIRGVVALLLAQGVARKQLRIDRRYRPLPACTGRPCVQVSFVAVVWEGGK